MLFKVMRNESQIMTREDTPAIKLSYMPYKRVILEGAKFGHGHKQ